MKQKTAQERREKQETVPLQVRHQMLKDFNLESEDSKFSHSLLVSCINNDSISPSVKQCFLGFCMELGWSYQINPYMQKYSVNYNALFQRTTPGAPRKGICLLNAGLSKIRFSVCYRKSVFKMLICIEFFQGNAWICNTFKIFLRKSWHMQTEVFSILDKKMDE